MPKKGKVKTYNNETGEIEFIEIYMNKKDYTKVLNQLKEMKVEPYSEDLSEYYGIEDADIEGSFYIEERGAGGGSYHMLRDNRFYAFVNADGDVWNKYAQNRMHSYKWLLYKNGSCRLDALIYELKIMPAGSTSKGESIYSMSDMLVKTGFVLYK